MKSVKPTIKETETELCVDWRVDPYSIFTRYEKPTSPVNADEKGLGMDTVYDMDEADLKQFGEYEKQQRDKKHVVVARRDKEDDEDDEGECVWVALDCACSFYFFAKDDEGDERGDEYDEDDQDDEGNEEDEEEEAVMFEVRLEKEKSPPVSLLCVAGDDSRLYVEQLAMEGKAPVNFESLPETVRDRFYDFLDHIKVDDVFSNYIRRQYYKAKREAAKSTLEAFLEYVKPEAEAVKKAAPKAEKGEKQKKKH